MPYKSDQQRKWAHTAAGKKALGGEAAVHEWDEATKGKKLPKYAKSESLNKFGGMMQLGLKETNVAASPQTGMEAIPVKHPNLIKLKSFLMKCGR